VLHMLAGVAYPVAVKASAIRSSEGGFDTPERAVLTVEYPGMLDVRVARRSGGAA